MSRFESGWPQGHGSTVEHGETFHLPCLRAASLPVSMELKASLAGCRWNYICPMPRFPVRIRVAFKSHSSTDRARVSPPLPASGVSVIGRSMPPSLITIDGSMGEGGGQVLRTSLALSLVTGKPFRIEKIRAGREKPGLLRQHLTAVNAAAAVGGAHVEGAALGSRELDFRPGPAKPGEYRFAVGTAGSATLVLQAVLPALLTARGASTLVLEGGTHNPFAPPFDFLDKAFLPLLRRMGARVEVALERPGFYPAGGGRFQVRVEPVERLERLDLPSRGDAKRR